jgi:hypothetical protein
MPEFFTAAGSWKPQPCKICGETATARFWIYDEPPPQRPPDRRSPIGESYMHESGKADCVAYTHKHRGREEAK